MVQVVGLGAAPQRALTPALSTECPLPPLHCEWGTGELQCPCVPMLAKVLPELRPTLPAGTGGVLPLPHPGGPVPPLLGHVWGGDTSDLFLAVPHCSSPIAPDVLLSWGRDQRDGAGLAGTWGLELLLGFVANSIILGH